MGNSEKVCVICGKSCDGQARIKNAQGQYAHQTCVEQKKKGVSPQASKPRVAPEDAGSMAAILSDLGEEDMIGGSQSCQGCGYPMDTDAMICLHCGFNRESGKQFNTKVARDPNKPTMGGKAMGAGAAAGGLALRPLFPVIGACVAGLLGAAIWGGIAYAFHYEFGWIAMIVGAMCGIGAGFGARGETGPMVGVIAAVVAIGSIALGKYMALSWFMDDIFEMDEFAQISLGEVDDSLILSRIANDISRDFLDAGRTIDWPNPEVFIEAAVFPDDYPEVIVDQTFEIWDDMSFGDKYEYRTMIAGEFSIRPMDVEDEWIRETIASNLCLEQIELGTPLVWSNPYLPLKVCSWPYDYPESIQTQASQRWEVMNTNEQQDLRVAVMDEHNIERDRNTVGEEFVKAGFIESYQHPLEVVFALLAIGAAYKIGAYE